MADRPGPRFEDRVFITGKTGTGKSTLARSLFLAAPAPRIVLDPIGSDMTQVPGAVTFHDPTRRTNDAGEDWWTAATARFVPRQPKDIEAYSDLCNRLYVSGRRCYVWVDEAGLIMPASGINTGANTLLLAGRKVPIGIIGCHTRPRHVDRDMVTQASHVMVFRTPNVQDRQYLADNMCCPRDVFEAAHAQLSEHGWLWWDGHRSHITICTPDR